MPQVSLPWGFWGLSFTFCWLLTTDNYVLLSSPATSLSLLFFSWISITIYSLHLKKMVPLLFALFYCEIWYIDYVPKRKLGLSLWDRLGVYLRYFDIILCNYIFVRASTLHNGGGVYEGKMLSLPFIYVHICELLQRGNEKRTKYIRPHLHHECVNFSGLPLPHRNSTLERKPSLLASEPSGAQHI